MLRPRTSSSVAADAPTAEGVGEGPQRAAMGTLPWAEIVRWAVLGTLVLLLAVVVDVARFGGRNPVSLIQPGQQGPSAALVSEDFPTVELPEGDGLDGQQYYAMARNPTGLEAAGDHLDWPRYRWQRPLLPWTAALVSAGGTGLPLIWALFGVGLLAALGGAIATGALASTWRGPPWLAAAFPLLPGAWWSLRVTVSDALALALALGALAFAARSRNGAAVALGVLAVLAKEPAILLFVGWALHRRTRASVVLAALPAVIAGGWMVLLATQLPPDPDRAQDIGLPFVGLVDAARDIWLRGDELVGMACTVGGLIIGVVALARRGLRHPLGWALTIQLGFLAVMGMNPLAANFGATRMAMPLMVLAILALATPAAAEADADVALGSRAAGRAQARR